MKTANLIYAILWAVLAVLMLGCAIFQLVNAQYTFVLIAAVAFGADSYNAWYNFGQWLDYRKMLKSTNLKVVNEF